MLAMQIKERVSSKPIDVDACNAGECRVGLMDVWDMICTTNGHTDRLVHQGHSFTLRDRLTDLTVKPNSVGIRL